MIACDIDEVLAHSVEMMVRYLNANHGTSLSRDVIDRWDIHEIVGCSKDEMNGRWDEFYKSPFYFAVQPVIGSVDGVYGLVKNHPIVAITARPEAIKESTLGWLSAHFPFRAQDVHFVGKRTKADVCLDIGARVLIEDNASYARKCADSGVRVLLMDCPWNQGVEHPLIERVRSWSEISYRIG